MEYSIKTQFLGLVMTQKKVVLKMGIFWKWERLMRTWVWGFWTERKVKQRCVNIHVILYCSVSLEKGQESDEKHICMMKCIAKVFVVTAVTSHSLIIFQQIYYIYKDVTVATVWCQKMDLHYFVWERSESHAFVLK